MVARLFLDGTAVNIDWGVVALISKKSWRFLWNYANVDGQAASGGAWAPLKPLHDDIFDGVFQFFRAVALEHKGDDFQSRVTGNVFTTAPEIQTSAIPTDSFGLMDYNLVPNFLFTKFKDETADIAALDKLGTELDPRAVCIDPQNRGIRVYWDIAYVNKTTDEKKAIEIDQAVIPDATLESDWYLTQPGSYQGSPNQSRGTKEALRYLLFKEALLKSGVNPSAYENPSTPFSTQEAFIAHKKKLFGALDKMITIMADLDGGNPPGDNEAYIRGERKLIARQNNFPFARVLQVMFFPRQKTTSGSAFPDPIPSHQVGANELRIQLMPELRSGLPVVDA